MTDSFFDLPPEDRLDALEVVVSKSGKPAHLLEKDIWVVWTLRALFDSPFAGNLVLKGGTSLSKGYQVIDRFSEDIDVTYDIRVFAPDLVSGADDGLPPSRSQAERWTKEIRKRLQVWVHDTVSPMLIERLRDKSMAGFVTAKEGTAEIEYEAQTEGTGYVRPVVLVEFGARSTGEPSEQRSVTCDAAQHLPDITFPTAVPAIMRPERTFWEKATAIHAFCRQGRFRGGARFSRHWYDVASLDHAGFVQTAIADRDLAQRVARHKSFFFRESDADGAVINYEHAVGGGLQLVPTGAAEESLAADYDGMVRDGLVFEEAPDFTSLVAHCRAIQDRANEAAS